jgi:hypothetical protein
MVQEEKDGKKEETWREIFPSCCKKSRAACKLDANEKMTNKEEADKKQRMDEARVQEENGGEFRRWRVYFMYWRRTGVGDERYKVNRLCTARGCELNEVIHFVPPPPPPSIPRAIRRGGPETPDFFGTCHFEGHWKGWVLKIKTFLGPRKVSIFRARIPLLMTLEMDLPASYSCS